MHNRYESNYISSSITNIAVCSRPYCAFRVSSHTLPVTSERLLRLDVRFCHHTCKHARAHTDAPTHPHTHAHTVCLGLEQDETARNLVKNIAQCNLIIEKKLL